MLSVSLAPFRNLGETGRMVRFLLVSLVLLLPSCSDWPSLPQSSSPVESDAWPALVPLAQISGPAANEDPEAIREDLDARTARLKARAAILRQPAQDADAMEELRQRLAG